MLPKSNRKAVVAKIATSVANNLTECITVTYLPNSPGCKYHNIDKSSLDPIP